MSTTTGAAYNLSPDRIEALIALIRARAGGGLFGFGGTWASGAGGGNVLHADSPFQTPAAHVFVPVDTTGGAVTVNAPASPFDGMNWNVSDATGHAALQPITVAATGVGINLEDPSNPGTFGAAGTIATQGGKVTWKFRKATNTWILWSLA
jgi:hypothetical protein